MAAFRPHVCVPESSVAWSLRPDLNRDIDFGRKAQRIDLLYPNARFLPVFMPSVGKASGEFCRRESCNNFFPLIDVPGTGVTMFFASQVPGSRVAACYRQSYKRHVYQRADPPLSAFGSPVQNLLYLKNS